MYSKIWVWVNWNVQTHAKGKVTEGPKVDSQSELWETTSPMQWEHVFIPLWSPYITHLGKWIGLTLHVTVFTLPSIHKWQRERKYSRDFIFWSGVWIVRGIWRMKLSLLAGLFETWTDSLWCLSPFSLLKSAYLRDYIRFFACFCRLSI